MGDIISDTRADATYTYNAAGRMKTVAKDGCYTASYTYNHFDQQVKREVDSGIMGLCITDLTGTPFDLIIRNVFDLDGNRVAEYEVGGASPVLLREYIWHEGKPVAVVENDELTHIRTDHIHCPAGFCLQYPRGGRPVLATDDIGTIA